MDQGRARDLIYPIVEHAAGVAAERLSGSLVEITKRFILDTLAVMIAGKRSPGCAEIVRYARNWQGKPDATLVTGDRAPAPYAALANSMMAHAVEFDDTYEPADVHAYAVVLPAVLAAAELDPERVVAGPEIIAAAAVGVDIAYRLGAAIRNYRGWHPTATCGIFGATLAAGRIAGCDRARLHHAMGIAYSLAAGNFQSVVDGSLTKRLQPGFAARGAVEAVLLARAGITGARDILEGRFGYFPLYEAGEYDAAALTEGLGVSFLGERASMKPYPCCRFCHASIDAALAIAAESDFPSLEAAMRSIAAIEIELPAETYDYVGRPFALGDNPQVAAQFSVAYTVASALLRRRVGLEQFSLAAVSDPDVLALAARVSVVPRHDLGRYGANTVRVRLTAKRSFERRVGVMKGEPGLPLTALEHRDKIASCIAFGGLPAAAAADLAAWAEALDRAPAPLQRLHAIFRAGATS